MKNRILIALFFLISLVSNVVLAQQPPYSQLRNRETEKVFKEQLERRHHIIDEQNLPKNRPNNQSFNAEITTLNALIPDFQVNENAGPNGASQEYPSISTDDSGNFVMTWRDERNGYSDIYAQRYSRDGSVLGTNFKVNDDFGSGEWGPSICTDNSGNFVITWGDRRNGNGDIYAQRYSSDGTVTGMNFKVNDDQGGAWQYDPSISTDSSGNFVITWEDNRNGFPDIYAQRYSSDGTFLGTNFKVNDDQGSAYQGPPSISSDNSGNFVITWGDRRNGYDDIYAQRYSIDGSVLGTNFKVNDDQGDAWQYDPSISTYASGNFVITWEDNRNGYYGDIYAQRYTSTGSILGTNFKVNDDQQANAYQEYPTIFADSSGNFIVTWSDRRNGNWDIYVQCYSSYGTAIGTNFKVNDDLGSEWQWRPAICTDNSGNFVVTWMDRRIGGSYFDIYAQRYSSGGTVRGTNFKVNDDQGSAWQTEPSISTDESGNFVITWEDGRNDGCDIYAQRYSSDGSVLGTNFKINDDLGGAEQWSPSICTDNSGNFMITWGDYRNGNSDIYAQRYSIDGSVLGSNFKVNDDPGSAGQWSPSICTDNSGNFVLTWMDRRIGGSYFDIYAQRYSSGGTVRGTNFKVNDDQGSAWQTEPSISTDESGNFVITWEDGRNDLSDIYAQRYSGDGSVLGTNFKVNDDLGGADQWSPSICTDSSGNFVITWQDSRNGDSDIYAQRYSNDGGVLGTNFKVSDGDGTKWQWIPSISTESSGNFVITWEDHRNGDYDIYAQCYSSNGSAVDSNFMVTNTSEKRQSSPDVRLWNNRIYCTWTDNHVGGTGYDIWANVLDWTDPRDGELIEVPSFFNLQQNYPNPFNGTTQILYSVPKPGVVTLKVYDTIGREVQTLVNEFKVEGTYPVEFIANRLSTGIYFYTLQVGSDIVETKKMIYLR